MKKHLSFIIWVLVFTFIIAASSSFIYIVNEHSKKESEQEKIDNAVEILNLDVEEIEFYNVDNLISIHEPSDSSTYYNNYYRLLLQYDEETKMYKELFTLLPGEEITYENYDYAIMIAYKVPINSATSGVDPKIVDVINILLRTLSTEDGTWFYLASDSIYDENITFYLSPSLNDLTKYIEHKTAVK